MKQFLENIVFKRYIALNFGFLFKLSVSRETIFMSNHIKVGSYGEEEACAYLLKNRYKLIDRNYKNRWGEIDIIAINTDYFLVFVEVKTVKLFDFFPVDNSEIMGITPEDNLTKDKLTKLTKICSFYANHNKDKIKYTGWQIDLIAITMTPDMKISQLRHYENVNLT